MHFSIFALLTSAYVSPSFGGSVEVFDSDGQCMIWSNYNHGCTGHSAPFAKLDGQDCSNLSEVNGMRQDHTWLYVYACGTENGAPAALIKVEQTGLITFANQNGDRSSCTLNNGLRIGSQCTPSSSRSPPNLVPAPILPTTSSSIPNPSPTSSLAVSTCGCFPN